MAFKIVIERSSDEDLFFFISPEFIVLREFPKALASSKNKGSRTQYSRCTEMFLKESKMGSGEPDSAITLRLIIK